MTSQLVQTALWCSPEIATSDHKPVGCCLELQRAPFRPRWLPRKPKNVLIGQTRKSVRTRTHTCRTAGNPRPPGRLAPRSAEV